jgi:hypothetical protein
MKFLKTSPLFGNLQPGISLLGIPNSHTLGELLVAAILVLNTAYTFKVNAVFRTRSNATKERNGINNEMRLNN